MTTTANIAWQRLAAADPTTLVDARLQLHHALQVIVSVGISYLPPRPDDSHTNLEWLPDFAALGTNRLESGQRLRFGLRPAELSLIALNDKRVTSELALDGRTVNEAVEWLRAALVAAGYDGSRLTTKRHYEIPTHRVASGAAFQRGVPEKFAELGRSYADAHALASYIVETRAGASPPRCWPHHFDLATLITLPEPPGRGTRTVGVGLSPGDDSYAEPYFYVGPYPHPKPELLNPLGSIGKWHTQGFVAAVLLASELAQFQTPESQRDAVLSFANSAVDASIAALV
ncbi:MAG: hypothetical protein ACRENH_14370 [Gemmatimonadaceae bacterium]